MKGENMSNRISQRAARSIVKEIGQVIDSNINVMDETGHIIASLDQSRIGMLHMGAKTIIEEELKEYIVTQEMVTVSTREGINLPIRVRNEVVGVIGITGPIEEVKGYGRLVQSMTQILLEEHFNEMDTRLERHIRYRYIEEWIHLGYGEQSLHFKERGRHIGIDITKLRRAVTIQIARLSALNETLVGQRKIDRIDDEIRLFVERIEEAAYLYLPSHYVCLFPLQDDEGMLKLCRKIADQVRQKYDEELFFGIDAMEKGSTDAAQMIDQAVRAMRAAKETDAPILFYHQLNLEMTLLDISEENMRHYLRVLFGSMSEKEWLAAMSLVESYFKAEGSIQKMASDLYLHPNTVQYRLKRLAEDTGYDLRKPSETAYYAIAQVFSRILNHKQGTV